MSLALAFTIGLGCGDGTAPADGSVDRHDAGDASGGKDGGAAGATSDAGGAEGGAAGADGGGAAGADGGGAAGADAGGDVAVDGPDGAAGMDGAALEAGADASDASDAASTNVTDVRAERMTVDLDAGDAGDGADAAAAVPAAPSDLLATVLERRGASFKISWKAPAAGGGGAVTTYDIRVARVPITAANFDDPSVGVVPYLGPPTPAGQPDSAVVTGLYIENAYYFAVAAVDTAGFRGEIAKTAVGVSSHFNITTLMGTSGLANEEAGYSIDGTGDANGDGKSDIVAGAFNSGNVYLFLGATTFAVAAPPSVVITGTTSTFGRGVGYVGDIDGDGLEDFGVGDTGGNQVFIYKGRATWPATLTQADANYVITTDTSYASSAFGTTVTRIGDFNGDAHDDFAVGSPNFGGTALRGRLTIILGGATFSSLALPSTTRAIVIDGDANLMRPFFGTRVAALGHFYPGTGTTIAVSAPGLNANGFASANEGHVYAFRGQAGTAGAIAIASADAVVAGDAAMMRIGSALTNLGPIVGTLPCVGAGNLNDATAPGNSGSVFVFSGNTTMGPFVSKTVFYAAGTGNTGVGIIGGGIPGRDKSFSIVGGSTPDLVVISRMATHLNIVDGAKLSGLTSPYNSNNADVNVPLPMGWDFTSSAATVVPDVNGDNVPDFVITNATTAVPGVIAVYW